MGRSRTPKDLKKRKIHITVQPKLMQFAEWYATNFMSMGASEFFEETAREYLRARGLDPLDPSNLPFIKKLQGGDVLVVMQDLQMKASTGKDSPTMSGIVRAAAQSVRP